MSDKFRIIAINLPQFHPFPENDEWWGKGFTEWTNVTKARPRFEGHYQPHLPADTGFYDLRLPEARQMQADLAKEYGIYGFCYYHYWFNGKQLMERPVNDILESGEPDFPFMLCWANENWARNWDGCFNDVLIEQHYSEEDDIAHIRYLCDKVFSDERYIRVGNKPVFAVYRIELFPDFKHTIEIWRKTAKEEYGMELYLLNAEFPQSPKGEEAHSMGLDASFDFQPIGWDRVFNEISSNIRKRKWISSLHIWRLFPFMRKRIDAIPYLVSYPGYVKRQRGLPMPKYKRYPCVTPSFDNSSRRQGKSFLAFIDSTPKFFGEWLRDVLERFVPYSKDENFVFINAWNEWAEGNHLEPDQKWGRGYLEEVKKSLLEFG